jgi:hypothetical protein
VRVVPHSCESGRYDLALDSCPIKDKADLIKTQLINMPDLILTSCQAGSGQEYECYMRLPEGLTTIKPQHTGDYGICRQDGLQKLGMAFCGGLRNEAK